MNAARNNPTDRSVVPPLVVTRDGTVLDELLRLAAAAGVTPDVVADAGAALRAWAAAPVVLVGADLADDVARIAPPRRAGVHVLSWGEVPSDLFRLAVLLGAEDVSSLPSSGEWVVEVLTDLDDQRPSRGAVLGVVGGSGGAGATTFACALGQLAARRGPACVVDADPLGPGVDRVLGLERAAGVRWEELCRTTGRLSARSLREALPSTGALGVLGWSPGRAEPLTAFAAREAMSAARRGHDTVVLDLPRAHDPVASELAARCDVVLVVVSPTLSGLAAAGRLCSSYADRGRLRVVVRGRGLDDRDVARALGLPVVASMTDQRGLAESIDLGLGPVRSPRGPLGRAAATVLDQLAHLERAA